MGGKNSIEKGTLSYLFFVSAILILIFFEGIIIPEMINRDSDQWVMAGVILAVIVPIGSVIFCIKGWRLFKKTKLYRRMKNG